MPTLIFAAEQLGDASFSLDLPSNYEPLALPGRDEWVAALRSGQHKQGRGRLTGPLGDCCLGVACRVMGMVEKTWAFGTPVPPGNSEGDQGPGFEYMGAIATKSLPTCPMSAVCGSHGTFPDGVVAYLTDDCGPKASSLTVLNDKFRASFWQIAKVIETVWAHAPLQIP